VTNRGEVGDDHVSPPDFLRHPPVSAEGRGILGLEEIDFAEIVEE
jgi:hypothetical protein